MKSDSGSVRKFEPDSANKFIRSPPRPFEYFDETLIDKKLEAVKQKNLVTTLRHDGI